MRALLTVAALVAASASAPAAASAQLAVDSLVRTLHLGAGADALTVTVSNLAAAPAGVTVEFADWELLPDGTHRFHPPGSLGDSCAGRITAQPATHRVAAGGSVAFQLLHGGTTGGACRIMVWFRTDDIPLDDEPGVALVIRTGVKLYVEPPG